MLETFRGWANENIEFVTFIGNLSLDKEAQNTEQKRVSRTGSPPTALDIGLHISFHAPEVAATFHVHHKSDHVNTSLEVFSPSTLQGS